MPRQKSTSKPIQNPKNSPFSWEAVVDKVLFAIDYGLSAAPALTAPTLSVSLNTIMAAYEKAQCDPPQVWKIKKLFRRWKKRKLLTLEEKDGELIATFTENGKKLLMKCKFDELKITVPEKWDGKWYLVIFDIPEKFKKSREYLRAKLKELGFFQLQKSVFILPYNCEKEIEMIASVYGIEEYVSYAKVEYLSPWDDEKVKDFFNLN